VGEFDQSTLYACMEILNPFIQLIYTKKKKRASSKMYTKHVGKTRCEGVYVWYICIQRSGEKYILVCVGNNTKKDTKKKKR
jgi:hypothetical protein